MFPVTNCWRQQSTCWRWRKHCLRLRLSVMTADKAASAIGVTKGAAPEGARDEQSAAAAVQSMFNTIAPRYDLLNHVLSANIDRLWWRRTARRFREVLANPDADVLDICCGTGDMTMALLKHRPQRARPVIAADFAREMLARGARKFQKHGGAIAVEADALHLP